MTEYTQAQQEAAPIPMHPVRVVMVHTSHSGNIGAAARAMKTMGLRDLCLVSPNDYPSGDAYARASGAQDVLDVARVVTHLDDAIADCSLVIGASARSRTLPWPMLNPREMADRIADQPGDAPVAILFGRESSGLTNDELARCHYHVQIPSDPTFSSLNVAAAIQVLTYELRMREVLAQPQTERTWGVEWDQPPATGRQLEGLFEHWQKTLVDIDFLDPNNPRTLMSKLRRLIMRAQPDETEANILRGMLTQIDKSIRKP